MVLLGLAAIGCLPFAAAGAGERNELPFVTNIMQFNRLSSGTNSPACAVRLQGVIVWAGRNGNEFVLQDNSAAELVEMPGQTQPVHPGEEVLLEGNCSRDHLGPEARIGSMVLVDNDGFHTTAEKSGTVTLSAGRYPVEITWFTRDAQPALDVFYQGPGIPRQKVPASRWYRPAAGAPSDDGWVQGLDYQSYLGDWWRLPDFRLCTPAVVGAAEDIALLVRARDTNSAVRFIGDIEIPRDGAYTFSTVSSGGSKLKMQLLRLKEIGERNVPPPNRVRIGQILTDSDDSQWSVVNGVVSFVGSSAIPGMNLELTSSAGHIRVHLDDATDVYPIVLLHSRVEVTGILQRAFSLEGQMIPGEMWVPDIKNIRILEPPPLLWSSAQSAVIREVLGKSTSLTNGEMFRLRGTLRAVGPNQMTIEDATGQIALQGSQLPFNLADYLVDLLATAVVTPTNVLARCAFWEVVNPSTTVADLPTLTTVEQIKRLKRAEALRGYPVHLSGTITWSAGSAVVIQDSTGGIFVSEVPVIDADGFRLGEHWDIDGITYDQFSPMILARHVARKGLGLMPEPIRPTWDQLINGSLDTEYVEVRGIVTGAQSNTVSLLTYGGKIHLALPETTPASLSPYVGGLVRIRGCLWATKNEVTYEFKIGEAEIHDATVELEEAAPANPFSAPLKRPAELLLFDAKAGIFQRVKVRGQIISARPPEYYLMDGDTGLRFESMNAPALVPGDEVETVGFPQLGEPSPLLREALVRRTGHSSLPDAKKLTDDTLLTEGHDATLVQVDAQLVKVTTDQRDAVLEMQAGAQTFRARLRGQAEAAQLLRLGSRLRLTGTYLENAVGRTNSSFELLLNYPSDIVVLAKPPWWTLQRLLVIVGLLFVVLVATLLWNNILRQKVEQRTVQLRDEIYARERVERQRAIEADRSRIARDLHDDLGASLSEITLLADAGPGQPPTISRAVQRFQTIAEKARTLVASLDVTVWLINPRKDMLSFLISYIGSYAEEYLSNSGIRCHLTVPQEIPAISLTAEVRHSLFLAVKESLHNIIRHSHASEVTMEMVLESDQLGIKISDNGCGFDFNRDPNANGLFNLRQRLTDLGGHCEIDSKPEAGTSVLLSLPLLKQPA